MSDKIKYLTKQTFDDVVAEDKVSMVDFWANWCGPCKMLLPTIDQVAEEIGDSVNVCKVDVDKEESLAMRFGVMSIPTLLFFKKGEQVDKSVGLITKDKIMSIIAKHK